MVLKFLWILTWKKLWNSRIGSPLHSWYFHLCCDLVFNILNLFINTYVYLFHNWSDMANNVPCTQIGSQILGYSVYSFANCFLHNAHVKCFDELSQLKKVWDNIWYIPWVSNIVIHFYNEFIFVVGVYMCHCGYYMQVSGS